MFGPLTATKVATPVFTVPGVSKKSESNQAPPRRSTIDAHLQLSAEGLVPSPYYEDARVKGMVKHVAGLLAEKVIDPKWMANEFAGQIAKFDTLRFNRVAALCMQDSPRQWSVKKLSDGNVLSLTYKKNGAPFSKWNLARNVLVLISRISNNILRVIIGPDFRIQMRDDQVIVESRLNRTRVVVARE